MKKGAHLDAFLRSSKTVLTSKEASLMWQESASANTRARLHYAVKNGQLLSVRKGVYAKDENYNRQELAIKLYAPAYISFETVLASAGVVFQHYETIFVATRETKTVIIDEQEYCYRKLKDDILTNPLGIDVEGEVSIASVERALLDTLYLNKSYYFDNLSPIDWNTVEEMMGLYENKRVVKEVEALKAQSMEN